MQAFKNLLRSVVHSAEHFEEHFSCAKRFVGMPTTPIPSPKASLGTSTMAQPSACEVTLMAGVLVAVTTRRSPAGATGFLTSRVKP